MAYTFPMSLTQFFDGLPIEFSTPELGEALDYSQTGAGEVLTADLGPRLWKMGVTIRLGHYAEIEKVRAKLSLLRQAGRSFFVHSMPLIAPQSDPTGSILGSSVVKLTSVNANNREVSLSGLPPSYKITTGDFMSFAYGSGPVRYAMHQFVEDRTADVGGVISNVEVSSFVRPGAAPETDIRLVKPFFKAVVVPGSTNTGRSGQLVTEGLSFSVIQTLR